MCVTLHCSCPSPAAVTLKQVVELAEFANTYNSHQLFIYCLQLISFNLAYYLAGGCVGLSSVHCRWHKYSHLCIVHTCIWIIVAYYSTKYIVAHYWLCFSYYIHCMYMHVYSQCFKGSSIRMYTHCNGKHNLPCFCTILCSVSTNAAVSTCTAGTCREYVLRF